MKLQVQKKEELDARNKWMVMISNKQKKIQDNLSKKGITFWILKGLHESLRKQEILWKKTRN